MCKDLGKDLLQTDDLLAAERADGSDDFLWVERLMLYTNSVNALDMCVGKGDKKKAEKMTVGSKVEVTKDYATHGDAGKFSKVACLSRIVLMSVYQRPHIVGLFCP